jgi:putative hydrolase of the HAD superfamily
MTLRAVLFDLGDTLWHFPELPSLDAIARESGRRLDERLAAWGAGQPGLGEGLARAVMDADREATRAGMLGDGRSPDFPALVRECALALGLVLDDARAAVLWDELHVGGPFLKRAMFPDSVPLLEELRRRGYRVASVTNRSLGGLRFREEMEAMSLMHLFDAMAVSADHGWLKPHRALFDKALSDLGVAPEEAVMVGDDLRADVYGARSIGMVAVWKRPPNREEVPVRLNDGSEVRPDFTIDHPGQLLELPLFGR